MEQQQTFSHGLLYSVAPEDLAELHLQDDTKVDDFEWEQQETGLGAIVKTVISGLLKPSETK